MPEVPYENINCDTEGVVPTITGIMGTLQANEVLNSILDFKTDMEKKMIVFDSIKMNFRKVRLSKNKNAKTDAKIYYNFLFYFLSLLFK